MVKKRNEAGARGLSPEGSAAEAKRMRRQTAKDDRARRRRTYRYAEPGAGSPTKGWRGVPSPQAPVTHRAAFSAATSDPRAASGVLVARLPAVAKGSPLSRDETLPGTGPLQRRSNGTVFVKRSTKPFRKAPRRPFRRRCTW